MPFLLVTLMLATFVSEPSLHEGPRLYGGIDLGEDVIVFSYAGDLWSVPRTGGTATRLTSTPAEESYPQLSPGGETIAFTGEDGGDCVWTLPIAGGQPTQLTHHPKSDIVRGWTQDGRVIFTSQRTGDRPLRLYTLAPGEHFPTDLGVPEGEQAAISPDGREMIYLPRLYPGENSHYRHYRGGMISELWRLDIESGRSERLTPEDSNSRFPMWIDGKLYYATDRSGNFNLVEHDLESGEVRPLTQFEDWPIRWASAGPGGIVFARAGRLHVLDIATGKIETPTIAIELDERERSPKSEPAGRWTDSASLSPDGRHIVVSARGDIATFDPSQNLGQPLTRSSSSAERGAEWSPDGQWIAYFSDASGQYQLHLQPAGGGEARAIDIEEHPSFYRQIVWSPDSKRLAFSGKRLGLWLADVESGLCERIAQSRYLAQETFDPAWSPDSMSLAYSLGQPNHVRRIRLYDLFTREHIDITDGRADAFAPAFDRNGQYLYFLASNQSVHAAANRIWGLLSAVRDRATVTSTVHAVLLRSDIPAPFLQFSSRLHPEAKPGEAAPDFRIDFEGIQDRIVKIPLADRDYADLQTAAPGVVYVRYAQYPEAPGAANGLPTPLARYTLAEHRFEQVAPDVDDFTISADGSSVLYSVSGGWHIAATARADSGGALGLDALRLEIDPAQEWAQMYRESWRLMRDFFYDPGHHGQDLAAIEAHYADYLPGLMRREDLTHLLRESLGHVSISHMSIGGGDAPRRPTTNPRVGLLGADFEVDQDRYRITKIYAGGHYTTTAQLAEQGPLAAPGVNAAEGDYLIAVEGQDLRASSQNIYAAFEGKAYQPVRITLAKTPDGEDAREMLVVATGGDNTLRRVSWFEENRRRVDELSNGRLGYVYAYNHGGALDETLRDLLAAGDSKEGLIIDQRFSPGGLTSDFLIRLLQRELIYRYAFPYGEDLTVPTTLVDGPRVLLINEYNGSAAETFPLMFEAAKIGTIVGRRTLGGGTGGALFYPRLIDGGRVVIPNRASYQPQAGYWLENRGVAPDVEIGWSVTDWRAGRDRQLEKAVEIALEKIESKAAPGRPAYPVHPGGTSKEAANH
ncbi:MAG: PDZ domain-containing protein [Planctomycetota bacterium]